MWTFRAPSSAIVSSAIRKSVVLELLADEELGLVLVGRDQVRLGFGAEPQRLTLGVEHDLTPRRVRSRTASA